MASVKPALHPLKTPQSASFPSELPRSPLPGGVAELVKQEEGIKTPITPPTAYMDFLKALSSPSLGSPTAGDKSGKSSPTSNASSGSSGSCSCEARRSPRYFAVPPSPYSKPLSAPATGPSRRLKIPQSPMWSPIDSPMTPMTPMSARSVRSPFGIRSPTEWDVDGRVRAFDAPQIRQTKPVSVRQVVTRTVTYTPRIDPAPLPRGKKRRTE
ncbi:MAG: hypothetical protein M1832_002303 [Thelocarpon impressellum]|nr:MAG: hypothetical protein M1832_002303 [Thelocarpon impressellum]